MTEYSACDRWPEHPKPWFQRTLRKARSCGWTLTTGSSHQTFTISCPSGECTELIYKSGVGGESAALTTDKKIDRCLHCKGRADALERATTLLSQASLLVDAATRMIQSQNFNSQAETLIFEHQTFDEEWATELIAQADALADQAAQLLGESVPVTTVVQSTDETLGQARAILTPLPDANPLVKAQMKRLRTLRSDLGKLSRVTGNF